MMKLKGHTIIELKDVVTGKVEKIEKDNLVTNAVQEFLSLWQPILGWGAIAQYFMPLYRKFFGGLYIFDTAQVESAANTFLPNAATAKLVGYAGDAATDGNDPKRGSFNFAESEELVNGFKFVWDFGTSEANGTIASLSLTHPIAGYHGYHYHPEYALGGNASNTGNTPGNYKGMGWSSSTSSDGILNIGSYAIGANDPTAPSSHTWEAQMYKFTLSPQNINWKACGASYNETNAFEGNIKTNNINLKSLYGKKEFSRTSVTNTGQPYNDAVAFEVGSEIVLVWTYSSNSIQVNKYDKDTLALTDTYISDIHDATGKYVRNIRGNSCTGAAYRNGCLYFIGYDSGDAANQGYVIRFNLSTKAATVLTPKFTITQSSTSGTLYCHAFVYKDVNGNIYAGGYVIDNNDNYIENDLANPGTGYNDWRSFLADNYGYMQIPSSNSPYFYPNLQYLATINNLASPVIKTSSKVMKVTYTLTEAT